MDTPNIIDKKLTTAEFIAFIQAPENAAYRWELIDGAPVKMPPSSQMNSAISMLLAHFLVAFVLPRKLGFVTGSDGGYRMLNGDIQQPDVAFISRARHTTLDGVVFPIAPDLAIEIISPSEESNDIVKKVQNYIFSGATLVWLVYPKTRSVFIWQRGTGASLNVEEFNEAAMLSGGTVLPDFTLAVKDIFPD